MSTKQCHGMPSMLANTKIRSKRWNSVHLFAHSSHHQTVWHFHVNGNSPVLISLIAELKKRILLYLMVLFMLEQPEFMLFIEFNVTYSKKKMKTGAGANQRKRWNKYIYEERAHARIKVACEFIGQLSYISTLEIGISIELLLSLGIKKLINGLHEITLHPYRCHCSNFFLQMRRSSNWQFSRHFFHSFSFQTDSRFVNLVSFFTYTNAIQTDLNA